MAQGSTKGIPLDSDATFSGNSDALVPTQKATKSFLTNNFKSKNYVQNGNAEDTAITPSAYADAAGASPVDGTGGSPSVTITQTTSSPLAGTTSWLITKDAASRQGQGISFPFTIDLADKGKVLSVSCDYILGSGSFTAGSPTTDSDVTVWIYDITNSRLIQPTEYKLYSNSSANPFGFIGTFQTSPDSTSYRLIFHVATTNASAWTLKIDNVVVGPILKTVTSAIQSGIEYTPSSSISNTASNNFVYTRIGDLCKMSIGINYTGGGPTAFTIAQILPPGLSIDYSKLGNIDTTTRSPVGTYLAVDAGIATYANIVYLQHTDSFYPLFLPTYFTPGSPDGIAMEIEVPIAGWGSNVELNSMDSNRPVHAKYNVTPSLGLTADVTPIQWSTKEVDTHNAVTTGSSWRFTAPVNGQYIIIGSKITDGAGTTVSLWKNGVQYNVLTSTTSAGYADTFVGFASCLAGDYLDIRSANNQNVYASNYAFISISKFDSATQIGTNETVAASYYCSAGQSNSSSTPINFDTKIDDTHNAVAVAAGNPPYWKFTAPVNGLYKVGGAHNSASGTGFYIQLYKNGSLHMGNVGYVTSDGTTGYSAQLRLLAGDYIDLRGSSSNTASGGALSAGPARIEISRIN